MSNIPYTTLKVGDTVYVVGTSHTKLSSAQEVDISKLFDVTGFDYEGRKHNKYISNVFLRSKDGRREIRVSVGQLAKCNPNFEPGGVFLTCVSCGATVTTEELNCVVGLKGIHSCPSCGVLDPTSS